MGNGHLLRIKNKRVPVLLTSKTIQLRQTKYLVHDELTLRHFLIFLRNNRYIYVNSGDGFYITCNGNIPSSSVLMVDLYRCCDEQGYLNLSIERSQFFG
jgi:hypothetical protein